jgi:hypothetical protein
VAWQKKYNAACGQMSNLMFGKLLHSADHNLAGSVYGGACTAKLLMNVR